MLKNVSLLRDTGGNYINWDKERDVWYHELVKDASDKL